ncbi:transposase [Streptomyces canus]|uniref:transposase n=1 Tax=Streptomyces canus TaxID=58343 RepID=UPI003F4BA6F7
MTSVLGLLDEREAAARVRVDGLREEAAPLAAVLEAAETELDRRVITREELVEALAVSAAGTIAVTEVEALRHWVRQAEADAGERDDRLTTAERDELKQLRRENAELKRANVIL